MPPLLSGVPKDTRSLRCVLVASIVSVLFILALSLSPSSSSLSSPSLCCRRRRFYLVRNPRPYPPSLAYLISGSDGDADRLLRLLSAVYHPRNVYLLHLDLAASQEQRRSFALTISSVPVFRSASNVHVIGKADFADRRGSSALSAVLHGAAILLRLGANWDWFINLDASDYPLVTQDDILHIFSFLPKDINFVQHSGHIGWRESRRIKPVIVDSGLYHSSKSDVIYATQKRNLPNAYRLFSGSGSVILSRKFLDFCILGVDNLPRTLLMYYANIPSSHTNYFQTLLCNSIQFNGSIVNHNLRYTAWDEPRRQDLPRVLSSADLGNMTQSRAAFGARFERNSSVLDQIDRELLNRRPGRMVPGGWCLGDGGADGDPCSVWGSAEVLRPGPGAKRLENLVVELLASDSFHSNQCKWE
ncbi:unnamed protein product [Spirodela intermedia]|uniref:Uncharacterized protein n=1 Tax=Spirodela intermedia TaxID=51605 RepID=A0A7I8IX41_SPIIN|nr:unnamed protein product [Spirodela intermedia]CAA6662566.1 unnamed protein product [Spirodela intermedia]